MKPEQWARIKEIFNDAVELKQENRTAFVANACGGDLELQNEVESLLNSMNSTGGEFMERPAVEVAAQLIAEEPAESLVGAEFKHYQILSLLGTGGMANVYRAHDAKLNREVAIKVLPQAFARDRDRRSRFRREAQLLASLNHPNIASIYGIEEDDQWFVLALELVEGETLAEKVSRGAFAIVEALRVGLQITEGLAAAHEKTIVHRDLKPANVKVTPQGVVKLLDFGLAKIFGSNIPAGLYATPLVSSKPRLILGTLSYMSPEQMRGKPVDRRTDIWSWGCLIYELLTGERAFKGEVTTELLARIENEDPAWSKLPPATPASIRALLHKCLEKDAGHRLHNILDAREPVEAALNELRAKDDPKRWYSQLTRLFKGPKAG